MGRQSSATVNRLSLSLSFFLSLFLSHTHRHISWVMLILSISHTYSMCAVFTVCLNHSDISCLKGFCYYSTFRLHTCKLAVILKDTGRCEDARVKKTIDEAHGWEQRWVRCREVDSNTRQHDPQLFWEGCRGSLVSFISVAPLCILRLSLPNILSY